MERNYILIWDDIDPGVLRTNPDLYRLLKLGYNRTTSKISIATAKQGVNAEFNVFGPKVASTIHSSIYTLPEFSELSRRLLLIKTSKISDYHPVELYDPQFIDWNDSPQTYNDYWNDEDNVIQFVRFQKDLSKNRPKHIKSENYLLYISLGATMLSTGLMSNRKEVISFFEEYDKHRSSLIELNKNNLYILLKDYIVDCKIKHEKLEDEMGESIPFIISPKALDIQVAIAHSNGLLDVTPNLELKKQSMQQLGFKLTLDGWIEDATN